MDSWSGQIEVARIWKHCSKGAFLRLAKKHFRFCSHRFAGGDRRVTVDEQGNDTNKYLHKCHPISEVRSMWTIRFVDFHQFFRRLSRSTTISRKDSSEFAMFSESYKKNMSLNEIEGQNVLQRHRPWRAAGSVLGVTMAATGTVSFSIGVRSLLRHDQVNNSIEFESSYPVDVRFPSDSSIDTGSAVLGICWLAFLFADRYLPPTLDTLDCSCSSSFS